MKSVLLTVFCAAAAFSQGVVAGHVTLSVEEYNRLLEIAAKRPKGPEKPPLAYTIQSAALKLRVEGESVVGSVDLKGEVLDKQSVKVPLVTGVTVLDALQSGRPLPLMQQGGVHSAILGGASDYDITLQAGLPLTIEPGRASFTLTAPVAGTVRLELTVPGEQTMVNMTPGLITERDSARGKTTLQATLQPGKMTTIWWASRLTVAPSAPKEVRFLSEIKTLVTLSEADIVLSVLANVTVVQGEPDQFLMDLPSGFEVTGTTGATLLASENAANRLKLRVNDTHARTHQFLISLSKAVTTGSHELPLAGFAASQRETGEVLIEGIGTMELTSAERGGLHRIDVKEASAQLRSLAKNPVHAAFRYQKRSTETPAVAMKWVHFPDTPVVSAVAERAVATTLVTREGRSLTEIKLTVRNREQAFVKVTLPQGAQILSADVAGEKVKPVTAADGDRVPLLRPGFRPVAEYPVSFVFLHSGSPFARKGVGELTLPKLDIPVGLVTWELFLPKQYRVADFGGDAISERLLSAPPTQIADTFVVSGFSSLGSFGGTIVDAQGAGIPRANITVTLPDGSARRTVADDHGRWGIAGVPSGHVRIQAGASGFNTYVRDADYDAGRPGQFMFRLDVGSVAETVTVTASPSVLNTMNSSVSTVIDAHQNERLPARQKEPMPDTAASSNVTALQTRVAGVLPIAVNIPKAGNAYRFVRPLVVDEETRVTFRYRESR
jgi:Carboxypeptidase regulatory-like domain